MTAMLIIDCYNAIIIYKFSDQEKLPPTPQTIFAEPVYDNATNPVHQPSSVSSEMNQSSDLILQLIEKLSQLYDTGGLTDEEFNSTKSDLLTRL